MHEGSIVLIIQAVTTFMLLGVCWFSQLVHYPLYRKIKEGFVQYERAQLRYLACLVIPLMIIETATAVMLITTRRQGVEVSLSIFNLIVLVVIWVITLLFHVKYLQSLTVRSSKRTISRLIGTNWIRTVLWTIKSCIIGAIIYYAIGI
jgi:hypothetical protein